MNNCCFKFQGQFFNFGGGEEFIEVANYASLPTTGSTSVIYVTLDDNKLYRWTGSTYVELSAGGGTPSYKVFTALLNQSGGDDPQTWLNADNGNLVIGVTYEIANYATGDDFTNVGAPSNANGVKFIATGNTAATWSGATELKFNYGAPVVTVFENTIGNIWTTFDSDGFYFINSDGLFTNGKIWVQNIIVTNSPDLCLFNTGSVSAIECISTGGNSVFDEIPIEIRVYN